VQRNIDVEATVVAKYGVVAPLLDERARRLWAAAESLAIGYGGDALVSAATGLSRVTIRNGRHEVTQGVEVTGRVRRAGAGRPGIEQTQPGVTAALDQLVEPLTRGAPTSPLRWTCKSRAKLAAAFLQRQQPVIYVDTKKQELVGDFKNAGQEWQPTGAPERARVHDFPSDAVGKATPYGVYDMARNEAWVSVGRDHDTPAFAVASIRQ
jgi:hypothetical protein